MTDQVKVVPVPEDIKSIVITSDGYPFIYQNLHDTEKTLEKILSEDPLCYKKFKNMRGIKRGMLSFDDRSYVRIET
jgi:glycerophosphoryl diester phosphodiesterase